MSTKKQLLISMANSLNEAIQAASKLHDSSFVEPLGLVLEDVEAGLAELLVPEPKSKKWAQTSCADLDMADKHGIHGRSWEGSKFWDMTEEDFSRKKEEHIAP